MTAAASGIARLTCPKCRRRAYVVCSNRQCSCRRNVPKGKKWLRWTRDGEGERCPYCKFTAHADFWFNRALRNIWRGDSTEASP